MKSFSHFQSYVLATDISCKHNNSIFHFTSPGSFCLTVNIITMSSSLGPDNVRVLHLCYVTALHCLLTCPPSFCSSTSQTASLSFGLHVTADGSKLHVVELWAQRSKRRIQATCVGQFCTSWHNYGLKGETWLHHMPVITNSTCTPPFLSAWSRFLGKAVPLTKPRIQLTVSENGLILSKSYFTGTAKQKNNAKVCLSRGLV